MIYRMAAKGQLAHNSLSINVLTIALLTVAAALPYPSLAQIDSTRVDTGLIVLYDFAEGGGEVVQDVSAVGSPLDLTIADTTAVSWLPGGGLSLDTPTLVSSGGPATKVFDAVTASKAITIEAWLAPANIAQNGPARILTCSNSSSTRNFTLGQGVYNAGDDRFVMRMRTTETDNNGKPETATLDGTLTTELTHVVFTREESGIVTFYLDGDVALWDFTGGTMDNWDATYPLALGDELTTGRPWLGSFHLVAIYDQSLTLAEVIQNFNAGPSGEAVSTAPVIRSEPSAIGTVGQAYSYQILASGFPAPMFALLDGPAGMTINPATGLVNWTPGSAGEYPVEISVTNSEGSDGENYTISVFDEDPVLIDVWYGPHQRVGHLGTLQADFNVLGKVSDLAEVAVLTYNVNGGPHRQLTIGPDNLRLANPLDFNADIPVDQLLAGPNTVSVRSVLTSGLVATSDVAVTREMVGSQELPVAVAWDEVTEPQEAGQFVDGKWDLEIGGLRTLETGYDRLFLIGETTWEDYEILVPVTIHTIDESRAGLGLLMRFTGHITGGHRGFPETQPKSGYQPFGCIGWLRWSSGPTAPADIQFYRGDNDDVINMGTLAASPGGTYWMRVRCETQDDAPTGEGFTIYKMKIWDATGTEPASWHEFPQTSAYALRAGGVALVAHHVDATFGDVLISEVTPPISAVEDLARPAITLHQNHPNPFNPSTLISLDLGRESSVSLQIMDLQGHRIRNLFTGTLPRGAHAFRWDGRDESGRESASGIYFLQLDSGDYADTRKMTLVR